MSSADDYAAAPISVIREVDALCDQYETALRHGHDPPLGELLSKGSPSAQSRLLRELTLVRLSRCDRGQASALFDGLLGANPDLADELRTLQGDAEIRSMLDADPRAAEVASEQQRSTDAGSAATVDFDSGRAATIDSDRSPVRCSGCNTYYFVDLDTRVRDAACPRCSVPLGSGSSERNQPTARPGSEPTVNLSPESVLAADSLVTQRTTASGERFRKLGLHAVGGLGEVYVARDEQLDRDVALKEMQERHADAPEKRERFLLEGCVTGRLEHPGIVPVHSLGADGLGRPFYTMRFIRGNSLSRAIKLMHREPDFQVHPSDAALRGLLQSFIAACHAIEYAHSRGVLHCDLKPDNIMVGKFGETYVVDWGMARVEGEKLLAYSHDGETPPERWRSLSAGREGSAMGTPAYMSPEQATGEMGRLREAADIFSLGATLYQILTGKPPYTGGSVTDVLSRAAAADFQPPRQLVPQIPKPLEAICLKALAEYPQDRYVSAKQLGEEVDRWLGDEPLLASPDGPLDRVRRYARRNRGLVASIVGAVAAVAVVSTVSALAVNRARLAQQRLAAHNQRLAASEAEARQDAEQRFEQARETVDVWLTGFSEALHQYPGMVELRRTMLQRAADEYERFAAEELGQPGLQEERARTLVRLGNLRRELGESSAAVGAYNRALESLQQVLDQEEPPASALIELGRTRDRLALALRDEGQLAEAQAEGQAAIDVLKSLAGSDEPDQEATAALAAALLNQASLATAMEQLDVARQEYRRVGELIENLPAGQAATREFRELAATAKLGLGETALLAGDARDAERHFRRGVEALELLLELTQHDPAVRERLATARLALAGAFAARGDLAAQAATLAAATDDYAWLTAMFPRIVRHRENLAKTRTNRALQLLELGQTAEARDALALAIETQRELFADYPLNLDYVRDYAVSVDNAAQAQLLAGDVAGALATGDEAARVLRELAARAPQLAGLQERLAVVESHRAQAAWDLGDRDQAARLFATAGEIVAALSDANQDNAASLLPNLAAIESRHGWALWSQGDRAEASEHFGNAKQLWTTWNERSGAAQAAGQAASFLLICPDDEVRSPQAALVLATKALQQCPENRCFAAIAALARCELGDADVGSQAALLPSSSDATIADRHDAWLAYAGALVQQRQGKTELAKRLLQAARDWTAEKLPGDWELRALDALVARQLESTAAEPVDAAGQNEVEPESGSADSNDGGE